MSLNQILESNIDLEDEVVGVIGDEAWFYGLLNKAVISCSDHTNKFSKKFASGLCSIFNFWSGIPFNNIVLNDGEFLEDFDFNFIPTELIFLKSIKKYRVFINIVNGRDGSENGTKYFELMRSQNTKSTFLLL